MNYWSFASLEILFRCPQEFCRKLKTMSKIERERLHIRDELLSGEPEVDCFLDDMNSFYLVSAILHLVRSYLVNMVIARC